MRTSEDAMTKKRPSQICIVTVMGGDQVGIVGKLAMVMAKANINILDIDQKVIEGTFVMTMAADISQATIDMEQIKKRLDRTAKDMTLRITVQDENIFKAMHRM
jgi:ACT domain-containing protein